MKMAAQRGHRNETVVVIDTASGKTKAYDARIQFVDDRIKTVVATERDVPQKVTDSIADLIYSRDLFVSDLESMFDNLVIPTSKSETHQFSRKSSANTQSDSSPKEANAYEFIMNSSYRKELFDLFIALNPNFKDVKKKKSLTFTDIQASFQAKGISVNGGIKWVNENVKLPWSDGSYVIASINEDIENFEVVVAYDEGKNQIPVLKGNPDSPVGKHKILNGNHAEDYQNYLNTYYKIDFSKYPTGQSCTMSCREAGTATYVCTYSCK